MTRTRIHLPLAPVGLASRALAVAVSLALGLTAQNDSKQVVQKIANEVQSELEAIDRLLQQSGRAQGQKADGARELVSRSQESMEKVVRGMDRMIDELQKMAQQSQKQPSGSPPPEGQPGEPQGEPQEGQQPGETSGRPQGGQGQRQEIPTPDLAQRPDGEQPGQPQPGQPQPGQPQPGQEQPQGQQPQGQEPQDGQQPPQQGTNVVGGAPKEGETEQVGRGTEDGSWGDLQKYVPPDHLRGGVPEVPTRYRRLWEAFQRRSARPEPRR